MKESFIGWLIRCQEEGSLTQEEMDSVLLGDKKMAKRLLNEFMDYDQHLDDSVLLKFVKIAVTVLNQCKKK